MLYQNYSYLMKIVLFIFFNLKLYFSAQFRLKRISGQRKRKFISIFVQIQEIWMLRCSASYWTCWRSPRWWWWWWWRWWWRGTWMTWWWTLAWGRWEARDRRAILGKMLISGPAFPSQSLPLKPSGILLTSLVAYSNSSNSFSSSVHSLTSCDIFYHKYCFRLNMPFKIIGTEVHIFIFN